jgi:hypothetical protein
VGQEGHRNHSSLCRRWGYEPLMNQQWAFTVWRLLISNTLQGHCTAALSTPRPYQFCAHGSGFTVPVDMSDWKATCAAPFRSPGTRLCAESQWFMLRRRDLIEMIPNKRSENTLSRPTAGSCQPRLTLSVGKCTSVWFLEFDSFYALEALTRRLTGRSQKCLGTSAESQQIELHLVLVSGGPVCMHPDSSLTCTAPPQPPSRF